MSYQNLDNQVQLIGYLGADPEPLSGGDNPYTRFSVATTESYTNRNGEKVQDTTWHSIILGGKLAEFAVKFMKKGSRVLVQGSLKSKKYTDKNGVERISFFVRATDFRLMDKPSLEAQSNDGNQVQQPAKAQQQRVNSTQNTAPQPQQPVQNATPTQQPQQRAKVQPTVASQPVPEYTDADFDLNSDDLPF